MLNKVYCIYKHTNLINNKVYIGQTCQKPLNRWNKGLGYKNSPHFYSAILKYSWNNFSHEIILNGLNQEQANLRLQFYINYYRSNNPQYGYNSLLGGNNKIPNLQTRKLQSLSAAKRPIVTQETKNKLSKINKGHTKTESTRKKMSESSKIRLELKEFSRLRPVKCVNTGLIFPSLRSAANWCGLIGTSGIALVCNHKKQITAGTHPITKEKLKWLYISKEGD